MGFNGLRCALEYSRPLLKTPFSNSDIPIFSPSQFQIANEEKKLQSLVIKLQTIYIQIFMPIRLDMVMYSYLVTTPLIPMKTSPESYAVELRGP
jgi:hypothetical protein